MVLPTPHPIVAALPNTADSVLLTDLTSHASDLSEASHALRLALNAGEDDDLWSPLTMHAVTAYIRPFIHSNLRVRLDEMSEFPGIPAELQEVHEMIRKYRNTTVAHSQSDLTMSLAVAILDAGGMVHDVQGWTLLHPMPGTVAERFADLIGRIEAVVEDATHPVTERLRAQVRGASPETIAAWPQPEILAGRDRDFNGARRRTRTPRFTFYWGADRAVRQQ